MENSFSQKWPSDPLFDIHPHNEWREVVLYVDNVIKKKDQAFQFTTTLMELKDSIFSKISQREKDICLMNSQSVYIEEKSIK